ncbi:MAG TPA: hypothetical protein VGR08_03675, partial [Thermomicrobiales bacterium]|nr:hypothetical protein [Thermomicrobiales bacterium]
MTGTFGRRSAIGRLRNRPPRMKGNAAPPYRRRVVRPVRVTGRDRSSMVRALRQGPGIVVVEPPRPGGEHRKLSSRRRLRVDVLVPVLLFLFAAAQTLGAVDDTSFHPDESRWLNRAHFVRDLADPFGPTWEDYYTTRGQPPMGSYLMGI